LNWMGVIFDVHANTVVLLFLSMSYERKYF
jgi:hypothetical protein